ncbi:Lrp/AsnC family transcriptional regulator [Akkermansiaceae bacterium]|jgi:DNA-binding Lrp family transcriptional regulator|nr:Lrp/AsnC family transcriptional regulator [Akkermansiaceae bacterium]MDB4792722.1 Lrp/AsnC family transcriptional regulator [bacterium]MDA7930261.1 Lrp/AsnC family transcriptional regulator [Akkermansiaceae bacterium]MDA7933662.1 Lrp/AsnC family transcriptional regulator [Akkermansiaceae bacterium]MDA9830621.1 Lrp/AsnC family transcriptional regulator [Akkermansiaceae bacterium]
MNQLLDLLRRNARQSNAELAARTSSSEEAVAAQIAAWEEDGTIRGYQAMIDPALDGDDDVTAFIEVRLTPERGGGFDRLARRIARFEQVTSCYLISGGYDLLVMVEGKDLLSVAAFVSEKLSTIEGVISTATHFRLKSYKEKGFLFGEDSEVSRLPVAP